MKPEVIRLGEDIELHYYPRWLDDHHRFFIEAEKRQFSLEIVTTYEAARVAEIGLKQSLVLEDKK
jgi:hypothetical protein